MENKYIFIILMWLSLFGYILYKRNDSNTILLFMVIIFSYAIIYETKKPETHIFDKDLTYWIDALIHAETQNERNRCYYIIKDRLLYNNLLESEQRHNYTKISLILEEFEPNEPIEYNVEQRVFL